MAYCPDSLSVAWKLSGRARDRVFELPRDHLEKCLDIDEALQRLLGTPASVSTWMWVPAPWLYHARPIDVALASLFGCEQIRRRLLRELAEAGEDEGVYASLKNDCGGSAHGLL